MANDLQRNAYLRIIIETKLDGVFEWPMHQDKTESFENIFFTLFEKSLTVQVSFNYSSIF